MQSKSPRLTAGERKEAILAAVAPIFARQGREGTTTKEIAKAAGVSEALLYRHFVSKEALYENLEVYCAEANAVGSLMLTGAEPSTATLVTGVALLVQAVFPGIGNTQSHENTKRLVTSSMLGDGRFAKAFLDRHVKPWVEIFERSCQAASAAGDIQDGVHIDGVAIWFVHHLANTLHLVTLPDTRVVEYCVPQEQLVEIAVRFLLRGIGLKNAAIERYYDPKRLQTTFASVDQETP